MFEMTTPLLAPLNGRKHGRRKKPSGGRWRTVPNKVSCQPCNPELPFPPHAIAPSASLEAFPW
jgi:hypothetical protein